MNRWRGEAGPVGDQPDRPRTPPGVGALPLRRSEALQASATRQDYPSPFERKRSGTGG